ncbi:MAG: hypothetical protein KA327_00805, partial [Pseudarcicella sp.]|nr:hypothetical protein [Pseudarcicella sp.]
MKILLLTIVTIFLSNNAFSQNDSLVYKRGMLIFKGEKVRKFKAKSNILQFKESPEMQESIKAYKFNYFLTSFFSGFSGYMLGSTLDRYLNGHLFEKQLIYGSTSFALGVLFKLSTNHSLKKAVSIYNSKSSNNESSL